MGRNWTMASVVATGVLLLVAGLQAGQRAWGVQLKSKAGVAASGPRTAWSSSPRASIGALANGLYCGSPFENGVGVHDLGGLPSGLHVTVTVESYTDGFDPAAAVLVASLGQKAGDTVAVKTFYDNDSGGSGDARVDFVTPQAGTYLLVVNDYTDSMAGCYRYQMSIE